MVRWGRLHREGSNGMKLGNLGSPQEIREEKARCLEEGQGKYTDSQVALKWPMTLTSNMSVSFSHCQLWKNISRGPSLKEGKLRREGKTQKRKAMRVTGRNNESKACITFFVVWAQEMHTKAVQVLWGKALVRPALLHLPAILRLNSSGSPCFSFA